LPPADRPRPIGDGHVDVLIVRGARVDPIDGWGGEDVADQVLGVLRDAGLGGAIASVCTPRDVAELTTRRLVTLPSSRSFVDERGKRHSLQRLLSRRGLPFVGSTAEGHAARRKSHMKRVLAEHGLPTPRWTLVDDLERIDVGLRFPLVVKPEGASESVGVSRVDDAQELDATLRALALDGSLPALVEEWALQREFTVAVVGNGSERRGFPMEVMLPQGEQFLSADVKLHTLAQNAGCGRRRGRARPSRGARDPDVRRLRDPRHGPRRRPRRRGRPAGRHRRQHVSRTAPDQRAHQPLPVLPALRVRVRLRAERARDLRRVPATPWAAAAGRDRGGVRAAARRRPRLRLSRRVG
jgi:D-Ala-D-Ala ligase-like protein